MTPSRRRPRSIAAIARTAAPALLLVALAAGCGATAGTPHPRQAGRHAARRSEHHSAGIPAALVAEARPVGPGQRFQPPVRGPVVGACRLRLGRRVGVHVEVFARNLVVLLPAGIGTRPPRHELDGRIESARCYGAAVTLDPTGVILIRPGARLTVAELFRSWGESLGRRSLAGFPAPSGTTVRAFVDGRRKPGAVGAIRLTRHAEIVLEVAPFVPPHRSFTFPRGL